MGLFDSLKKKLTGAAEKSSNLIRGASENAGTIRTELSFNDILKDVSSYKAQEPSTPEQLYEKALDCAGVREYDGIYFTAIPEKIDSQDIDKAILYAERAYNAGLNKSLHILAQFYMRKGFIENKNYDLKIVGFLNEGIEKRDTFSMRMLSHFYQTGIRGVKVDYNRSKDLLEMAAQYGDPYAYAELASFCFLEGNNQQGLEYLEEALSIESASANMIAGNLYLHGSGVSKDSQKALAYYTKAAELGACDGYGQIGLIYSQTNPDKAKKYYQMGAKLGSPMSAWLYAQMLSENTSERYEWLKYAYMNGFCRWIFYSKNPSAPVYEYKCKMGTVIINIKSQNELKPEAQEVAEAYAAYYGKPLALSMFNTAVYTKL